MRAVVRYDARPPEENYANDPRTPVLFYHNFGDTSSIRELLGYFKGFTHTRLWS